MKKVLKIVGIVLAVILILVIGYVAYVFLAYKRIPDNQPLTVRNQEIQEFAQGEDQVYTIMTYNIGFGAYTQDYGFFMDGGTESWAVSKEGLLENLNDIIELMEAENPDFLLVQEVDQNGTRTYHVDEEELITSALTEKENYASVYAVNYDSPFLFYPFTQPHGANKSGMLTFSRYTISSSLRRSLPIEDSVKKLVDLDRAYSVSRIPMDNGKELVLYNFHLSAYTSDGTIAVEQLEMLLKDMQAEYEAGNYCIAGGDFNKDLSGNAETYYHTSAGDYTWAQPLPEGLFDGTNISLVFAYDPQNPVASCRNADGPYNENQYVLTVDGFLVSANVQVLASEVMDLQYMYSDHNPVTMSFQLQ